MVLQQSVAEPMVMVESTILPLPPYLFAIGHAERYDLTDVEVPASPTFSKAKGVLSKFVKGALNSENHSAAVIARLKEELRKEKAARSRLKQDAVKWTEGDQRELDVKIGGS